MRNTAKTTKKTTTDGLQKVDRNLSLFHTTQESPLLFSHQHQPVDGSTAFMMPNVAHFGLGEISRPICLLLFFSLVHPILRFLSFPIPIHWPLIEQSVAQEALLKVTPPPGFKLLELASRFRFSTLDSRLSILNSTTITNNSRVIPAQRAYKSAPRGTTTKL